MALQETLDIQYKTVSGIDANLLSLDIYHFTETSEKKPVIVYIHGGGWAVGDKDAVYSKATFFTGLGYVFVTMNYRLSPAANMVLPYGLFVGDDGNVGTASTRTKHSTHVQDCADAVTWVYNNISSYGGNKNKLVLMGHSAGAHLVSLLSTNQSYLTAAGLPPGKIIGCIANDSEAISGIFQQITDPVSDGDEDPSTIKRWYQNAFGIYPNKTVTGTISTITTDFATTAAAEASYATASPINYVSSSAPPFLFLSRGPASRITRETQFVTALRNVGGTITQVSYPGDTYTHMEINECVGATNDPPAGRTLPTGVANVSTQIRNFLSLILSPVDCSVESTKNLLDLYNQKLTLDKNQLAQITSVQTGYTITTGIGTTDYIKVWGPSEVIENYNCPIKKIDNRIVELNNQITDLRTEILSIGQQASNAGCGTTSSFVSVGASTINCKVYAFSGTNPFAETTQILTTSNLGVGVSNSVTSVGLGSYSGGIGSCYAVGCSSAPGGSCVAAAASITSLENQVVGIISQRDALITKVNFLKNGRMQYELQNYAYNQSKSQINDSIGISSSIIGFLQDPNNAEWL